MRTCSLRAVQLVGRHPRAKPTFVDVWNVGNGATSTIQRVSQISCRYNHYYAPIRLYSAHAQDESSSRRDAAVDLTVFPKDIQDFLGKVEDSLFQTILPETRRAFNLISSDQTNNKEPTVLLLGVSGGCDSMGLLHALLDISTPVVAETTPNQGGSHNPLHQPMRQFRDDQTCELHVVHFDHQQRGIESDRDCQLVHDCCQRKHIPCHVYRWEDNDRDNNTKFSQDKARQWRQSTMTELLRQLTTTSSQESTRSGMILTAHHLDDSQETLILKLLRGVHVKNLSGMDPLQEMDDSTVWARPLLALTKDQIRHYLTAQNYTWREDASNQSNKYLRNRVRNELIPLMQDMVGGEIALKRRLENLEEQCHDIRTDLTSRAESVLKENVDQDNRFLLTAVSFQEEDLVARHALYNWASAAANKHQFSYDLWQHVLYQLRDYPENRQWTLPLGGGWQVVRLGEALQVVFEDSAEEEHANSLFEKEESIPWSYVGVGSQQSAPQTSSCCLVVRPDPNIVDQSNNNKGSSSVLFSFVLSTAGAKNWKFTPPWRKGRSPLKLGSFLRGQKVPLHTRRTTPIILFYCDGSEPSLVAVLVDDEWIVDASWMPADQGGEGICSSSDMVLELQK